MEDVDGEIPRTQQGPVRTTGIPASITSTYSHINAEGNSRVHAGHVFHFHCTAQHHSDTAASIAQTTLKRKRSLADIGTAPRTREAQEDLDNALKKLGKLSQSIRGHRSMENGAEKIARRVSAVFDAIVTHSHGEGTSDHVMERQLGKLRGTVRWEEQFDINSVPQRRAMGTNARAKGRRILVQIGYWVISLTTTVFNMRHEGGLREEQVVSVLRIEPLLKASGSALAVYFSEYTDRHTRSLVPPVVLAYNTVSNSAEVFKLVLEDDLEGLQRVLACGEATIRDCDESGRSLLHVSFCARHTFWSLLTISVCLP